MARMRTRVKRARHASPKIKRMAFPILLILVMGVIVLGMFQYVALLAAGSVIFAWFFGWLWWTRRATTAAVTTRKAPARGKRQTRAR